MQLSQIKLFGDKRPKYNVNDQRLQNENRELKALEDRARWIFYETEKS